MGVSTISAEALAEEVAPATADASAARRRSEGPSRVRRVEEHLSAETREKLDAIWSRPSEDRKPG